LRDKQLVSARAGVLAETHDNARAAPRPPGSCRTAEGTDSATPLAWTHAQLVRPAWSIDSGRPVELPRARGLPVRGRLRLSAASPRGYVYVRTWTPKTPSEPVSTTQNGNIHQSRSRPAAVIAHPRSW
jgi:hypothetical protein